jgi:hypothetical protein
MTELDHDPEHSVVGDLSNRVTSDPEKVALFDARSMDSVATEELSRRLGVLNLRADFLSPVLELTPRTTWHDKGYLNFSSYVGVGAWFIYGETGEAQYIHTANESLWNLEVWFTDLDPAVYLVVLEVDCYGTQGNAPRFVVRGPGGPAQAVNTSPSIGRQYLGTIFAGGPGLNLVTLQQFDVSAFGFFRATLINVFG